MKHFFSHVGLCVLFCATAALADGPIPQPPGQPRPYSVVASAPTIPIYLQVLQATLVY